MELKLHQCVPKELSSEIPWQDQLGHKMELDLAEVDILSPSGIRTCQSVGRIVYSSTSSSLGAAAGTVLAAVLSWIYRISMFYCNLAATNSFLDEHTHTQKKGK